MSFKIKVLVAGVVAALCTSMPSYARKQTDVQYHNDRWEKLIFLIHFVT
jgi:hypothetical protein